MGLQYEQEKIFPFDKNYKQLIVQNFPICFLWIAGPDYPVPQKRWKEGLLNFQL